MKILCEVTSDRRNEGGGGEGRLQDAGSRADHFQFGGHILTCEHY